MSEDLEIYHQKGGTYVIPVEVINYWAGELEQLKEIEKEHQRINGELRVENKELKDRIDKAVEYIEQLEESEWRCFGRKILTEILKGDKEWKRKKNTIYTKEMKY